MIYKIIACIKLKGIKMKMINSEGKIWYKINQIKLDLTIFIDQKVRKLQCNFYKKIHIKLISLILKKKQFIFREELWQNHLYKEGMELVIVVKRFNPKDCQFSYIETVTEL